MHPRPHVPLVLALALAGARARGNEPVVDPDYEIEDRALVAHVRWLADDDRAGRAAGSPGCRAAADYAAEHFGALGLRPAGDADGFFQAFTLPRGHEVGEATALAARRGSRAVELERGDDFRPLSLSGPGDVDAPVVFAGYGIAAPELGWDDYADLDCRGRIVVVLRHAPEPDARKSPFANPRVLRRYATFKAKADTAAGAGAAALVVVNDARETSRKDDVAMRAVGGAPGPIPVVHVTHRAGRRLARVLGLELRSEQARMDRSRAPRSRPLEDDARLRVRVDLEPIRLDVRNVCALLEAPPRTATGGGAGDSAAAAPETLVVGAHFDHVGLGAYGSLAGPRGKNAIHNGADDNASGTAAVLEIAAWLRARRARLRRDVLFCLFTAEELGLLGSKHWVDHPTVPLERCVAMVNLDMVGRLGKGRLQIGGTGTSPVFPPLLEPLVETHGIAKVRFNPGGRAPSDNTSFYEKGLPVLFFFTGLHDDYHRPSDDWRRVDRRGLERVARLAADVCLDLASRPARPAFTRSDGTGLVAGPELGLTLEQRADGVYVVHVAERSPADRARIEAGDRVEEFEGQPVPTITAFNRIHAACRPHQKVALTVRRGARLLDRDVKLGDE